MNSRWCEMIRAAIPDEASASRLYRRLAAMAPSARTRETLRYMSRDEAEHRVFLMRMYRDFCRMSGP